MNTQPRKRLIFHWTTPKNLLAILIFAVLTVIIQGILIIYAIPTGTEDLTVFTLPLFNITLSLLYHLLPVTVIITLTASFTYLTTHTATISRKAVTPKKLPQRKTYQKPTRLKSLRNFYKKLQRTTRKVRTKILKTRAIAYIEHRVALAKTIIKSAATITITFVILVLLITVVAYPKLVPTVTMNFYEWNRAFLNFVTATIRASETIANTIPPIGAIATAIQSTLNTAAPAFRNTLEASASAMTAGLVSLSPTEKYLIIQNVSTWTVATTILLYNQYVKMRRYRR